MQLPIIPTTEIQDIINKVSIVIPSIDNNIKNQKAATDTYDIYAKINQLLYENNIHLLNNSLEKTKILIMIVTIQQYLLDIVSKYAHKANFIPRTLIIEDRTCISDTISYLDINNTRAKPTDQQNRILIENFRTLFRNIDSYLKQREIPPDSSELISYIDTLLKPHNIPKIDRIILLLSIFNYSINKIIDLYQENVYNRDSTLKNKPVDEYVNTVIKLMQ
jgi:hypothetical protein